MLPVRCRILAQWRAEFNNTGCNGKEFIRAECHRPEGETPGNQIRGRNACSAIGDQRGEEKNKPPSWITSPAVNFPKAEADLTSRALVCGETAEMKEDRERAGGCAEAWRFF